MLPHFAIKEGVVAIGELGYDEQTELEDKYLRAQIELAKELELPIMIHTPASRQEARHAAHHGRARGARLRSRRAASSTTTTRRPCEEVLDRGYFAGFSIYPQTKMGNERMTEIVRQYGAERIIVEFRLRLGRVRSARRAEDRAR